MCVLFSYVYMFLLLFEKDLNEGKTLLIIERLNRMALIFKVCCNRHKLVYLIIRLCTCLQYQPVSTGLFNIHRSIQ